MGSYHQVVIKDRRVHIVPFFTLSQPRPTTCSCATSKTSRVETIALRNRLIIPKSANVHFPSSIEHYFPALYLKFCPRGSKQSDKCTMASIPGAVFKAGKIHDEIARFRKRSASDAVESKSVRDSVNDQDAVFRERSGSFTTPPSTVPSQPTSGLTSALSGDSIRNMVGGLIGSLNNLRQKTVDSSLESVNEDFPAMRNYPNPGSFTDLVHMK